MARDKQPDLRDHLYEKLREFNVFARRYFYPLCSDANCYRALPSAGADKLPVARQAAREVLALPFYSALGVEGVHRVAVGGRAAPRAAAPTREVAAIAVRQFGLPRLLAGLGVQANRELLLPFVGVFRGGYEQLLTDDDRTAVPDANAL